MPAVLLALRGAHQTAQVAWIPLANLDTLQGLPQNVFGSAAIGGIVLALAATGVRRTSPAICLAAAGFVPPTLLLAAGTVVPVWVGRYVLVAVPALAVLAAAGATRAGATRARATRARAGGVVLLAVLLSWPVQVELRGPAGHAQDSARIAEVIGARRAPGDVVVFPDTHRSIPWAARDIYERYLPTPRPPDVLAVVPQRVDGRLLARECPGAVCLGAPARVWVVRADDAADPLRDMGAAKRARIGGAYRPVQRWSFPLLSITLMERAGG
ncbi:hypothetical protein [Spirilliplanes yamanashiensis]|nr:hypothetical protein [Spirilliplanes yamanashiensis]MDP9815530.1 hypothetical protein [Spirilliplanes yamanashiensis]